MRTEMIIGLFFGFLVLYITGQGIFDKTKKQYDAGLTPEKKPNLTATPTPAPKTWTSSEVALHNNAESCFLIISNGVYDVSSYLMAHPGGSMVVLPFCGKEATWAFETMAGNGQHSNKAKQLLNSYLVGQLTAK